MLDQFINSYTTCTDPAILEGDEKGIIPQLQTALETFCSVPQQKQQLLNFLQTNRNSKTFIQAHNFQILFLALSRQDAELIDVLSGEICSKRLVTPLVITTVSAYYSPGPRLDTGLIHLQSGNHERIRQSLSTLQRGSGRPLPPGFNFTPPAVRERNENEAPEAPTFR
jgi:hypothetical protein